MRLGGGEGREGETERERTKRLERSDKQRRTLRRVKSENGGSDAQSNVEISTGEGVIDHVK